VTNFRWGIIAAISALFVSVFLGLVSGVSVFHIFVRALVFSAVFFGIGFGLRFVVNSFFPELLIADYEAPQGVKEQPNMQVSLTLDSTGEYAVPELYKSSSDSQELGNIEDLISGIFRPRTSEDDQMAAEKPHEYSGFDFPVLGDEGIDRKKETGYNDTGVSQDIPFRESFTSPESDAFEKPMAEKQEVFQQQFTPSFGDDSGLGGLPDLDMMAMAFSSTFGPASAPAAAPTAPSVSASSYAPPVEELEPDRSRYTGNKPETLKGDFDAKGLAEGIRTVLSKDK